MPVTRTTNPLHFEDLEPHRFEDLVRQLAYNFRQWESLEAVGRTGADEGADILGREAAPTVERPFDDLEGEIPSALDHSPKIWVFQCKREKAIPPRKSGRYVRESLHGKASPIYGYILAAAADFSTKTRLTVRTEAAKYGVVVVHIWGKAELEDMLFQPENDHLLFAYFGLSLQARRRSERTRLSARVAVKRKLISIIPLRHPGSRSVLLRDPRAVEYPFIDDLVRFREAPGWRYFEPNGHWPQDHIRFVVRNTRAWYNPEMGEWDVPRLSPLMPANDSLFGLPDAYRDQEHEELKQLFRAVPENRSANIQIMQYLSYDRILAVDEIGDAYNDGPHLLIERDPEWGFFEPELVTPILNVSEYQKTNLDMDKRIDYFGSVSSA